MQSEIIKEQKCLTISEAVKKGALKLKQCGIENADYDSFALLSEINGMDKTYYLLNGEKELSEEEQRCFFSYITRRSLHEPLQHILGKAYFYGFEFLVNSDVLIPRQDTEILVDEVLKVCNKETVIADMCTGSGCIILSVALIGGIKKGIGIDISKKALEVAQVNRKSLSAKNVEFICSDLFEDIELQEHSIDVLVSNPPYIATKEIEELSEEVRLHDPILALDGHEDGLHFYRKITEQSKRYLKQGGWLFYEIGYDQSEAVEKLMRAAGYQQVCTVKDLAGHDRVVKGRL